MPSYYEILGVDENASLDVVKRAYKKLSLKYHPDKATQRGEDVKTAREHFDKIRKAYEAILNPDVYVHETSEEEIDLVPVNSELNAQRPSEILAEELAHLAKLYAEEHKEQPPTMIQVEARQEVLQKSTPLLSKHFSSLEYQNLYVLTFENEDGDTVDEQFHDVFSFIQAKEKFFASDDVKNITIDSVDKALEHFLNFLKGRYYGESLAGFKKSLQVRVLTDSQHKTLYEAILSFISINNVNESHKAALVAIEDIFNAMHTKFTMIGSRLHALDMALEERKADYDSKLNLVKESEADLADAKRLEQESARKLDRLSLKISKLNELMEDLLLDESAKYKSAQDKLARLKEQLQDAEQEHRSILDKVAIISLRLQEVSLDFEAEKSQSEQLKAERDKVKKTQISECFVSLIESKYFRITLASIVGSYWSDPTSVLTVTNFAEMADGCIENTLENRKKFNAFGKLILHADERAHILGVRELTVDEYIDNANFFFDLSQTVPSVAIKIKSFVLSGACWQMVADRTLEPVSQKLHERSALYMYQTAIRLITKVPIPFALYQLIHLPKYLVAFKYKLNTTTVKDLEKMLKNLDPLEENPTVKKARYGVYTGTSLESLESVMDRAFYSISCMPICYTKGYFLGQVREGAFLLELQERLVEEFGRRQDDRLHQDFEVLPEDAELFYQLYEKKLLSGSVSEDELNALRLRAMHGLLVQSRTSLFELNQFMSTPYVSMPQTKDGFWRTGSLNYPENAEEFGLIIYKSFDGYSVDTKTGKINLFLTRWIPGDDFSDRLFTHQDVLDLIQGGVGYAIFSLDANGVYRQFDPLQKVRFGPQNLKGLEYLRCLFATDYIMKMYSQGREVRSLPPYDTRPISALFDGLDEDIVKDLSVCANTYPDKEQPHATRFWIEMGDIPIFRETVGCRVFVHFGTPEACVKKQLLSQDAHGHQVDAPVDLDDCSPEARFAQSFTKHYDVIAQKIPVFKQLKEFYKLTGAIQRLQSERELYIREFERITPLLTDDEYWAKEKENERRRLKTLDWDKFKVDRVEFWTSRAHNDKYWASRVEELAEGFRTLNQAIKAREGESYTDIRNTVNDEYQALVKLVKDRRCTIDRELIDATEDDKLYAFRLLVANIFKKIKSTMSCTAYNRARDAYLVRDFTPMAEGRARYVVTKILSGQYSSQEETDIFAAYKLRFLNVIRASLLVTLNSSKITVADLEIKKSSYSDTDTEFRTFYAKFRKEKRQLLIQGNREGYFSKIKASRRASLLSENNYDVRKANLRQKMLEGLDSYEVAREKQRQVFIDDLKPKIPNWELFKGEYLRQVDEVLNQKFPNKAQFIAERDREIETVINSQFPSRVDFDRQISTQIEATIAEELANPRIEAIFIKQIEAVLDRDFSEQSQLNEFNKMISILQSTRKSSLVDSLSTKLEQLSELQKNLGEAVDLFLQGDMEELANLLLQALFENFKKLGVDAVLLDREEEKALSALYVEETARQVAIIERESLESETVDYSYLQEYFAGIAFERSLQAFLSGNVQTFFDDFLESKLISYQEEFSCDLEEKAKALVIEEREDLQKNIESRAQKEVDDLRSNVENRLEEHLQVFIGNKKRQLRSELTSYERLEANFTSLKLGKKGDSSVNTSFRIPAVLSQRPNGYVYGGVNAVPSFNSLENSIISSINKKSNSISSVFTTTEYSIRDAEHFMSSMGSYSLNLRVMSALNRLQDSINYARNQQIYNTISYSTSQLHKENINFFESMPHTPGSVMFACRMEEAARQRPSSFSIPRADDMPRVEIPRRNVPRAETPRADMPRADMPRAEMPNYERSQIDPSFIFQIQNPTGSSSSPERSQFDKILPIFSLVAILNLADGEHKPLSQDSSILYLQSPLADSSYHSAGYGSITGDDNPMYRVILDKMKSSSQPIFLSSTPIRDASVTFKPTVFRGDSRGPQQIFRDGFTARGDNLDVLTHVQTTAHGSNSAYVATTTDRKVAEKFPSGLHPDGTFVYEISRPKTGVNIAPYLKTAPDALDVAHYLREKEIAIPHKITVDEIKGAWKVELIEPTAKNRRFRRVLDETSYIPNPSYKVGDIHISATRLLSTAHTVGLGVTVYAIAEDGTRLYRSYKSSQNSNNYKPFYRDTAEVTGGWTGALVGGRVGAQVGSSIGFSIGGPIGTAVGAISGGIGGAIFGYNTGSEVANHIYDSLDNSENQDVFEENIDFLEQFIQVEEERVVSSRDSRKVYSFFAPKPKDRKDREEILPSNSIMLGVD